MLLRRITKHVTEQNWFAVFIDFLIVVVGVFIGIQVANWNESLAEKAKFKQQLGVLRLEMIANIEELQTSTDQLNRQFDSMVQLRKVFGASGKPIEPSELDHLLMQSIRVVITVTASDSFNKIISAELLPDLASEHLINQMRQWAIYVSALNRTTRDDLAFRDTVLFPYFNASLSTAAMIYTYQDRFLDNKEIAASEFNLNNYETLRDDPKLENIIAIKQATLMLQLDSIASLLKSAQDIVSAIEAESTVDN